MSSDAQDTDILRVDYRKSIQEVIRDVIRFLYFCDIDWTPTGLSRTIQRFLLDLGSLNDIALKTFIESSRTKHIALLRERGQEVKITEEIVEVAVQNKSSGKVMELLLQQGGEAVKITEGAVVQLARLFDAKIMELLLQQGGEEVKITEAVVIAAAQNQRNGKEVVKLLLQQGREEVKITEAVVKAAAQNQRNGKEVVKLLLQQRGEKVIITEELVEAAGQNEKSGKEVAELLLQHRERWSWSWYMWRASTSKRSGKPPALRSIGKKTDCPRKRIAGDATASAPRRSKRRRNR